MNSDIDYRDPGSRSEALGVDLARGQVDAVHLAIEDAARTLFREHEFVAVRMSDIAARADVSPTSIYARFASKSALYREVMDADPPEDDSVRATGRGRRTRDRLVTAAGDLFERRGYADATIGEISEAAGCSAATFYTYFATKEMLFRHVVLRHARSLFDHLWSDDAEPSPSRSSDDDWVLRVCERYLSGYRRYGRVLTSLEYAAAGSTEFAGLRDSVRAPFLQRLGEMVARDQAAGSIPLQPTAETCAAFLLGSLEGVAAESAEQAISAPDLASLLSRSLALATPA